MNSRNRITLRSIYYNIARCVQFLDAVDSKSYLKTATATHSVSRSAPVPTRCRHPMTAPADLLELADLCPFCGRTGASTEIDSGQGSKWESAFCVHCGARGPDVRTGYDQSPDAHWRQEAIAAWNRRAGWQPIETAPIGTKILLGWSTHDLRVVGLFLQGQWVDAMEGSTFQPDPTHWQPLPEPPPR